MGAVVVMSTSSNERFTENGVVYIEDKAYTIKSVKPYKTNLLVFFKEVNSLTESEKLKGKALFSKTRPALLKDEFYYDELIGSKVYDLQNNFVGFITEIFELPQGIIFEVKGTKRYLLPFSYAFFKEKQQNKLIFDMEPFYED